MDIDAPGPVCFTLGVEHFGKSASPGTGWDGDISAVVVTAFPVARTNLLDRFAVFAGPGAVFASGDYSGSDDFGRMVEASGSSLGFGFCAGAEVTMYGPVSGRLEYRRAFLDLKTDAAVIDGVETSVWPAAETDLGFSQIGFTMMLALYGERGAVLGGF